MVKPQVFLLQLLCFFALVTTDPWVWVVPGGTFDLTPKLAYRTTPKGDRILDFSAVGYAAGRTPLPTTPPVKITLLPCGGGSDDTDALQAAVDTVSAMQLDEQGFRGTIKLSSGTFNLGTKSILIAASRVVIDGSGVDQTLVNAHGLEAEVLFRIRGQPVTKLDQAPSATIVATVPSGTRTLVLSSIAGFSAGDQVSITWTWSREWIALMNMTDYWRPGYRYKAERIITSVSTPDSSIELDIPLSFRIDTDYLGTYTATVDRISTAGRISQVALRHFKAVKNITFPGTGCFLKMEDTEDSWITDLELHDFSGTILTKPPEFLHTTMAIAGTRVTIQNLVLHRFANATPGPKPFDIALHRPGQQILVRNVTVSGNFEYSFITGDSIAGPNVFHDCTGVGANIAQPHMKFATGLLYDSVRIPYGGIEMVNRRWFGSGHGIAAGFSVAWNTESRSLQVIGSPAAENWALGCRAREINNKIRDDEAGVVDGVVDPRIPSLFLAQRLAAGLATEF